MRRRLAQRVDVLAAGGDGDVPLIGDGSQQVLLADGRVIEQYSAQILDGGGASHGRVWFFRDITERRRLEKQILEAGERERQIIGQELHDDLCQQLTGIACLASVVRQRLGQRSADETADAARVVDLVRQATACARNLSKGLQPVTLDANGLLSSLQGLCARVEAASGRPCQFSGDAAPSSDDSAVPTHLYRIAQEAVTNAVKHAKARSISVDLVRAGDRLILSVEDDGVGIPEVLSGGGIGLQTMAHRARMIGATLTVERSSGGGTVVTCSLLDPGPATGPLPVIPAAAVRSERDQAGAEQAEAEQSHA
jgi:signal transduction histidine kinase